MSKVNSPATALRLPSAGKTRGAAVRPVRDRFQDIFRLTPLMAAVLAATAVPAYAQVAASANALTLRQGAGQTATSGDITYGFDDGNSDPT